MTRTLRPLFALAPALALLLTLALAGCSGDEEPQADPSDDSSASEAPVIPLTKQQTAQIKGHMPKARVLQLLGEPLLTQDPFTQFPGGCIYYAMEDTSPANVWQFCFDAKEEVSLLLTAYSPSQPAAPASASQARASLIARADSVCQGQYGYLNTITNDVGDALVAYADRATDDNLDKVVRAIGRFIANLKKTHEALAAFNPPPDNESAYADYVAALSDQIDALTAAQEAISEEDFEAYDEHGIEFNDIGQDANTAAQQYGFSTCSAPEWG